MTYRIEIYWEAADTAFQKYELRQQLRGALTQIGALPVWKEIMPCRQLFFNHRHGRLLVNGRKVHRIKDQQKVSKESLAEAITSYNNYRKDRSFRRMMPSIVPAVLIAFFPKCPICWAAYASLLSFIGIYIPYYEWVIWVFVALALINLLLTFRRSRSTNFYLPLLLQVTAYTTIVLNRMYWDNKAIIALCVVFMISSSVLLNLKKDFFYNLKLRLYGRRQPG